MIHEKPEISHLRVYSDGCSYEDKDEYLCIMTVHHIGDTAKYISGLKGTMNRKIYKKIKEHFLEQGVEKVTFERASCDGKTLPRKIERSE